MGLVQNKNRTLGLEVADIMGLKLKMVKWYGLVHPVAKQKLY